MAVPANFATLPTEILLLITSNLTTTGDVNAVCQVTRRLYHLFLPEVFDRHLAWARTFLTDRPQKPRECLVAVFLHAVKYNSSNLIQQLFCYRNVVDFKGTMPGMPFSHYGISYLHFAVTMDAPIIASHLMKHGSSSDSAIDNLSTTYPDLTPLYLALARPSFLTQKELNSALRIACSYALPKTTQFLLARGADSRAINTYGVSPLHSTLARRARFMFFDEFYAYMEPEISPEQLWEEFILSTVVNLIQFSADQRQKSQSTRVHSCNSRCWKSVSCEHSEQTPAHLAAGGGWVSILRLFKQGVGLGTLNEENGEGYTPFYVACVQGNEEAALYILRKNGHTPNPMVRKIDGSTALHIACRFALEQVVLYLLENGAAEDIDREDSQGRTPLHEALSSSNFEREEEIIGTLHILGSYGANPDHGFVLNSKSVARRAEKTPERMDTPRQMARKHAFVSVREMFQFEKHDIYRDMCYEEKNKVEDVTLPGTEVEVEPVTETLPVKKKRKPTKKQREKLEKQRVLQEAKEQDENFPALSKPVIKTMVAAPVLAVGNPNLPLNVYGRGSQSRKVIEWEEKKKSKVEMLALEEKYGNKAVVKDVGDVRTGDGPLGKGKVKGGKKWAKVSLF